MIIDRIKNIEYYETILPGLKDGLPSDSFRHRK